jgi:hypothetical protein
VGDCCTDEQCANPTPICKSNDCVACQNNDQCGEGRFCCNGSCGSGDCCTNADCPSGETCTNFNCECGTSGQSCAQGFTCCNGECRNTQTDRANCGACGHACRQVEVCHEGACGIACPGGPGDFCPVAAVACPALVIERQPDGSKRFDRPQGVAATADRIYVADTNNNRIQFFTRDGNFLGKWGSLGSGNGQFSTPVAAAIGPNGVVYVSDTDNERIQIFSSVGGFLGKWGSPGSGNGQFDGPEGIAVDVANRVVYVADGGNFRMQAFSQVGDFLATWGRFGNDPGEFRFPYGVAVTPSSQVLVSDALGDRVTIFCVALPCW